MRRDMTRRGLLGAGGATVGLGLAGCLGFRNGSQSGLDGTLAVTNAQQFRSPGCSCCGRYASYLREHIDGTLDETETDDVDAVKRRHDVPAELRSCHTLVVDSYVVEGHVPVEALATMLDEQPAIDGIALPGMPAGSPGMGGTKSEPFTVYGFGDGERGDVYAEI
ncbi:DUF411 domain-containing protein [Halostella litorea]|uniref:DUF411 domain-containing protein n=1 Tax=Halostella litorea TaxID=2528831 RepID=UPI001092C2E0|nr:DUF411 domain-containing protein [Halostella litorea]